MTIVLLCVVTLLFWFEMLAWWRGTEELHVSVEKGVGHAMQLNVDITVAMACEGSSLIINIDQTDLDVNVLDATGDRILASEELNRVQVALVKRTIVTVRWVSSQRLKQNSLRKPMEEKQSITIRYRKFSRPTSGEEGESSNQRSISHSV